MKIAEKFLKQALYKANTRGQHEVKNRVLFYLLRIAVAQGNFDGIQILLKDLETQLEIKEYSSRFITYDIVLSWYYSLIGQPQFVSSWIKGHFSHGPLATFNADFGNFIKAKFFYAEKRYHELLSFFENGQAASEEVLLGKLEKRVLEAVCQYQIKDKDAALLALREAYDLALSNNLIMPFIELGKDMRTLTTAAIRDKSHDIPRQWLEVINRKAATYAKRLLSIIAEYKKVNKLEDDVSLSPREKEVLDDLYHGLSRSEIAASRNLSVNTVKMVLNTVYSKLGADNIADAIRIAIDRKLIKR